MQWLHLNDLHISKHKTNFLSMLLNRRVSHAEKTQSSVEHIVSIYRLSPWCSMESQANIIFLKIFYNHAMPEEKESYNRTTMDKEIIAFAVRLLGKNIDEK